MRGFIDDVSHIDLDTVGGIASQSAFMRGFIDDTHLYTYVPPENEVSIRVHARLHR